MTTGGRSALLFLAVFLVFPSVTLAFSCCPSCLFFLSSLRTRGSRPFLFPSFKTAKTLDSRLKMSRMTGGEGILAFSCCHPCAREDPGSFLFPSFKTTKTLDPRLKMSRMTEGQVGLAFSCCPSCLFFLSSLRTRGSRPFLFPSFKTAKTLDSRLKMSRMTGGEGTFAFSCCHPCAREDPGSFLFPSFKTAKTLDSRLKMSRMTGGEASLRTRGSRVVFTKTAPQAGYLTL